MSIDTAADVFAHRLPVLVKQVQAKIARSHELWDLPGKCVRLLQILATFTPLDYPQQPLTFNRAKPANLLDVSVRTIDRCLNTLVERGLIIRVKQKRHGPGQWDCTSIRWAPVCVEKLFSHARKSPPFGQHAQDTQQLPHELVKQAESPNRPNLPPKANAPQAVATSNPIAVPDDDPETTLISCAHGATPLSHKTTPSSYEEVVNKPSADGPSDTQRLKQLMPRIPLDLITPCLDLGLNRVQVTTLMRRCQEIRQRLQDVLTLTITSLQQQQLRGREAMGWLLRVIGSGQDFHWLAKQRTHAQAQVIRAGRRQQFLQQVTTALAQGTHTLPDGMILKEVIADMAYLTHPGTLAQATMPIQVLAKRLMAKSPEWTKHLLRQERVEPGAPAGNPITIATKRELPPSSVVRNHVAALRSLLQGTAVES